MSGKKRTFSKELKMQIISEAEAGVPIAELNRRCELSHGMIAKWKKRMKKNSSNPFPGKGSRNTDKAKMAELERIIGRQAIEIDFLKNAIARLKETGR